MTIKTVRRIILTAALGGLLALASASPAMADFPPEECEDVDALVGQRSFDCDDSGELPLPF